MMRYASAGDFWNTALQDVDDELHGRVVVIEQDDAVQRRLLGFLPDAFLDLSAGLVLVPTLSAILTE